MDCAAGRREAGQGCGAGGLAGVYSQSQTKDTGEAAGATLFLGQPTTAYVYSPPLTFSTVPVM